MNEYCECPLAGYCNRHQMKKGQARFNLCKGVGGNKDCGLSYWQAWERGELGATAPDVPQMQPKGFCSNLELPTPIPENMSSIGTVLHSIIFRETGIEIPCQECKNRITMLNQMTKKQVVEKREEIIDDIHSRSQKQAPKLWQKIAISLDSLLDLGQAKKVIASWVDEAISLEPDFKISSASPEISKKKSPCRTC